MVPSPGGNVVVQDTLYYCGIGHCVGSTLLRGFNTISGKSYLRRHNWIEARLNLLRGAFAIGLRARLNLMH